LSAGSGHWPPVGILLISDSFLLSPDFCLLLVTRPAYKMNLGSEKKRLEKLHSWHNNPVKRGVVAQLGSYSVSAS
jgi:hypothetical protein